nr:PREDICTED: DNA cross-link repair 1A protein [Lepisosteus oculatus]
MSAVSLISNLNLYKFRRIAFLCSCLSGGAKNDSVLQSCTSEDQTQAALGSLEIKRDEDKQTPSKSLKEGYCPSCQMPFSILLVQSPQWHVAECLDKPENEELKECPDGLQCTSTIPGHYKRYTHFLLAQSRATSDYDNFILDSSQESSGFSNQNVNPSPPGGNQLVSSGKSNALLLLKAPAPEDVRKRKGWSPRATKEKKSPKSVDVKGCWESAILQEGKTCKPIKTSENEAQGENVKRHLTLGSNSSKEDISYSPLCSDIEDDTVNPRYKSLPASSPGHKKSDCTGLYNSETGPEPKTTTSQCPNLWEQDLSSDELFTDYFDLPAIEESQKALKPFSVTNSPLAVSLTQPDLQAGASNTSTGVNLSQMRSPAVKSLSQPSSGPGRSDSCCVTERRSATIEASHAKNEPSLQSPQSLVLQRLRDQLGNLENQKIISCSSDTGFFEVQQERRSSDPPEQRTPLHLPSMASKKIKAKSGTAGLRQTDIGVFFGLKALKEQEVKGNDTPRKEDIRTGVVSPSVRAGSRRQKKRKATSSLSDPNMLVVADGRNAKKESQTPVENVGWPRRKRWNRRQGEDESENTKQCPFYKKIPGTGFAVDAFQYGPIEGITGYFLTHFHSDHYSGLKKSFRLPIFCNKITGNLVKSKLRVEEQYVNILPMNAECTVEGVSVTLLDANHCPGAAMLLFQLPNGRTVLHTGDFRADPSMERYPELLGSKVQTLYLDTTYCSPEYTFPTQQEVISFAANTAFEHMTLNPQTLIVCGTYSIGKEKVFLAIAEVLGCKVCVSRDKYNTMCCLESDSIRERLTMDWNATQMHVLPMMQINFKGLQTHLNKFSGKYNQILAFKPTGWTFSSQNTCVESIQPVVRGNISIYGIPYSEHSSYLEMKRFVQWLKPEKILPTVNVGSWRSRKEMEMLFDKWMTEVRLEGMMCQPNAVTEPNCNLH